MEGTKSQQEREKERLDDGERGIHDTRSGMRSHHDRGYAWVVLAASAASSLVLSSIYTVGVFNLTFLEVFGQSKSVTAWCPAVMAGLLSLAGALYMVWLKCLHIRIYL